MKMSYFCYLLSFFAIINNFCWSQDVPEYIVEKLTDNIYKCYYNAGGYPVKVIAFSGPDGLLIVDSGEKETGKTF